MHSRAIREQTVKVCGECLFAHPKTLPKLPEDPEAACGKRSCERDPGGSEEPPGKRSKSFG
eukprot:1299678-Amphidinium_carterae.1